MNFCPFSCANLMKTIMNNFISCCATFRFSATLHRETIKKRSAAVLLCFNEQSESLLLQVKKKLEQRIAVTHLKFRASFPTSICIEVINYSSSKYYSTKPTFSVTHQTRQLCERFRCPLIQH